MVQRCPVCKADKPQAPTCRRCKADLSLVFALEERRTYLLAEARAALASGHVREGLARALEVDDLRRDEQSLRLVAVAALLCRDFHLAWRSYEAIKERFPPTASQP
jgi:hypothetical protein